MAARPPPLFVTKLQPTSSNDDAFGENSPGTVSNKKQKFGVNATNVGTAFKMDANGSKAKPAGCMGPSASASAARASSSSSSMGQGSTQNKYDRPTGQPGSAAMNHSRQQLAGSSSSATASSYPPTTHRPTSSDTFPRTKIVTGSTIRRKSFMDVEENFYSRATKDDEDIEEPDDSHSRGRSSQINSSSSNHHHHQQQQQQHNYQHHSSSNNNGVNRKSIAVNTHDGLSSMLSEGKKQQPANPAAAPYPPLTTTAKKQSSNSRGKQQQSQQSILQTTNGNKSRDENDSITRTNNHAAAATAAAQPKSQPYRNAKKSDKKVTPLVIDLAGDSDDNSDDDVEVCNDDRMDVADAKDGSHRQLASPGKQKFGNSYPQVHLTTVYLDNESFIAPMGQVGSGTGHRIEIRLGDDIDEGIVHLELRESTAVVGTDRSDSSSSSSSSSASSSSSSRANGDVKRNIVDVSFKDIHEIA